MRAKDGEADYGIDAPRVVTVLMVFAVLLLLLGLAVLSTGRGAGVLWLVLGAFIAAQAWVFLRTTRRGKFVVWEGILDDLELQGDEKVLDVGCGRGAVLVAVARRLPRGEITGVDLWRSVDQSGNSPDQTVANAVAEGVSDRIELHTADMTKLPYPDSCFDVVLSSLAIHNIKGRAGRRAAVEQAVRVLRPGGQLAITDIQATKIYVQRLTELGMENIEHSALGPDFWFGGPWMAATLVTATKPG